MIAKGITHRGMVREANQDTFLTYFSPDRTMALLVVCDGMGGAQAGNVASTTAARVFVDETIRLLEMEMAAHLAMKLAFEKTNTVVHHMSKDDPTLEGMGTTLVAALVRGREVLFLNVGDSRAYVVHSQGAEQISNDHSYVQELYRMGRLTKEQTRLHPNRNLITRAVGVEANVACDIFERQIGMQDVILLCTDGLTGMLTDDEIYGLVDFSPNLDAASKLLVASACQHGGSDNVTALLFCLTDDADWEEEGGLV